MYHPICIAISYYIIKNNFQDNEKIDIGNEMMIIILTFIMTIVTSMLSYNFFEKKILNLKPYFSKKSSGVKKVEQT
jgi:peptidoglycan/LPS O-acetylase OafA/YrhL